MESYAPRNDTQIEAQASTFRQIALNIYNVFGLHSARLYNADPRTHKGVWDTKFSVAALDMQAGALAGKPPGKVQAAAEQIREQYLYSLLSGPLLQSAISKQTGSTTHTKYRWTTFQVYCRAVYRGDSNQAQVLRYNIQAKPLRRIADMQALRKPDPHVRGHDCGPHSAV